MKTLRVAVIGTGFIGKQHIEAIRRIPGTLVVAVVEPNETMAAAVCERLGVPKYYLTYQELLAEEEVDVVHNCTPSAYHYQISKMAMMSGKHVLCEKPLTVTVAEAVELVETGKECNVALGTNFNYRQNAIVREIKERVKDGMIGKPLMVYAEYLQDWMLYETDYDWRLDQKIGGESRAVADIGSHCFDTLQFVLGSRIVSVYANLITVYPTRKKMEKENGSFSASNGKILEEVNVTSEDAAFIMIKFENGIQGLVRLSQVDAGKKNGLKIVVDGSMASLEWQQEKADRLFIGHRDRGNEEIYASEQYMTGDARSFATLPNGHAVGWADAFRNNIQCFYDSIRTGSYKSERQEYATFQDACYIMKIVDACLKSNRIQEWITVES